MFQLPKSIIAVVILAMPYSNLEEHQEPAMDYQLTAYSRIDEL